MAQNLTDAVRNENVIYAIQNEPSKPTHVWKTKF